VPKRLDLVLADINTQDRLALMALGARYLQSIVSAGTIVADKLVNPGSWSAARRATINEPSVDTLTLRVKLEAEFKRVLGPIPAEDFDTVFLTFMLGRRPNA
jgi:hypothetical protein